MEQAANSTQCCRRTNTRQMAYQIQDGQILVEVMRETRLVGCAHHNKRTLSQQAVGNAIPERHNTPETRSSQDESELRRQAQSIHKPTPHRGMPLAACRIGSTWFESL